MKALFLVYHGFSETNGISKKIHYQVDALKACGLDVRTCYLSESDGNKYRMIDNAILCDYGRGIKGKLLKRIEFNSIADYAINEDIRFVYIRSDHNANPFTIKMVKKMRKADIRVVMEIPTYPYDQEYRTLGLKEKTELAIDRIYRRALARQLRAVVTFSDLSSIFGQRTIRISNGVSFERIPVRREHDPVRGEVHLIAVADISFWHGFDRLVRGMAAYYACKQRPADVYLSIVGRGRAETLDELRRTVRQNGLERWVRFTGPLFGEALDREFDRADMAVGSLGRHRSGISYIKTLKNREYAVRGIPFVYSECDSDFERMPYVLKAPADESPLDVGALVAFCSGRRFSAAEIRESVRFLSWENQMRKVLDESLKTA